MGIRELPRAKFSDEHLASEVGGLYIQGAITLLEYEAGARYGKIILDYLRTIDAPDPYSGGRCEEFPDDACLTRKVNMAAAREILKSLDDPRCLQVVDRVTVYGDQLQDGELSLLRVGLRALAGE